MDFNKASLQSCTLSSQRNFIYNIGQKGEDSEYQYKIQLTGFQMQQNLL